jgi:antibiotic biosynthesis monooxygenase (ABM) superfamily enzyme
MEHEGRALAADETDAAHHRSAGVASVHVRAAVTWCAIFPLVAIGMTVMGPLTTDWSPVLRALLLTAVVVPLSVYVVVPRLLLGYARLSHTLLRNRRRSSQASERATAIIRIEKE